MSLGQWQELALSAYTADSAWELFHENSKLSKFSLSLSEKEVREYLSQLEESLTFEGYPIVPLPQDLLPLKEPLGKVILSRVSNREMKAGPISLDSLATLLRFSYGTNRKRIIPASKRSSRVVPSAGALYPIEIFLYVSHVIDLSAGLYHYDPCQHHLRLLDDRDLRAELSGSLVQTSLAQSAAVLVFITALFERSVFKYGERGYRFALLEAGHVAQNMNLVSTALKLATLNVGGFFDRDIDALLRLDGVTHSTIYMLAIGTKQKNRTAHHNHSRRRA